MAKLGSQIVCSNTECCKEFIKKEKRTQFCSKVCRWNAYYRKGREDRAAQRGRSSCKLCSRVYQLNRIDQVFCGKTCQQRHANTYRKFGIDPSKIEAIRIAQNNQCAICAMDISNDFNIDHCHETGIIRGWLCSQCNFMLGHARDSVDILRKGIEYLNASRENRTQDVQWQDQAFQV